MADVTTDSTRRLVSKKQTLDDAYAAPANFLEIDVVNPITHGVGNKRYTDYEVRMRVSRVSGRRAGLGAEGRVCGRVLPLPCPCQMTSLNYITKLSDDRNTMCE